MIVEVKKKKAGRSWRKGEGRNEKKKGRDMPETRFGHIPTF